MKAKEEAAASEKKKSFPSFSKNYGGFPS